MVQAFGCGSPDKLVRALLLLACMAAPVPGSQAERGDTSSRLSAGSRIDREISPGEVHRYRIALAEGRVLRITLDQRTTDFVVSLAGPAGDAQQFDSRWYGPEPVCVIARSSGMRTLEIRPVQKLNTKASYSLTVEAVRSVSGADSDLMQAIALSTEAKKLVTQPSAASFRTALRKYQEALPLWEALGDRHGAAQALNTLGFIYGLTGQTQKGLGVLEKALAIRKDLGDTYGQAETLGNVASMYSAMGSKAKALEYYLQAIALWRVSGDKARLATMLNNVGTVHGSMGEHHKALEAFAEALPLWEFLGSTAGEATALSGMAMIRQQFGEYQEALDLYTAAVPLMEKGGDRRASASLFGLLGQLHSQLGDYESALKYSHLALARIREAGDRRNEGTLLSSIGNIYLSSGDGERALEYSQRALPLLEAAGDRRFQAYTLANSGRALDLLGEKSKGLEHLKRAVQMMHAVDDPRGEGITLHDIGIICAALKEYQEAAERYDQGLDLFRKIGDRASEAGVLASMAKLDSSLGNLARARSRIEESLMLIESQRARLRAGELRASYLASMRGPYEINVDILMRLHQLEPTAGHDAEGLQASERERARVLLEALAAAGIDIRRGIDLSLIDQERKLRQTLNARSERLERLPASTPAQARTKAREDLESALAEYHGIQARIQAASPAYAALTQPQPLALPAIQRLLDRETVMLEYALGEERSYLWAVTPTQLRTFELPKRSEIEASARHVYELLTARNRSPRGESLQQRRARIDAADKEFPRVAAVLSSLLLAPAAALIQGKRLVIVADGVLQYVPFSALPLPGRRGRESAPLIADHEIVSLPSASVLGLLRTEAEFRPRPPAGIAVLADPVFDAQDSRVAGRRKAIAAAHPSPLPLSRQLERASLETGTIEEAIPILPRLPFTRMEADAISQVVPRDRVLKALDFQASRATAVSREFAAHRWVHIATHGLLNSEHPELSGLVLSLVDSQGRPQDGFLRLHEIYNLSLPVDLVVLSSCQTALGKEVKGEGLVGLTRGFMYAGATRVIASLWKVDDEATAHLMRAFYSAMAGKRKLTAAALRAAQVAIWNELRWRPAYYWAGFILQGEWN